MLVELVNIIQNKVFMLILSVIMIFFRLFILMQGVLIKICRNIQFMNELICTFDITAISESWLYDEKTATEFNIVYKRYF